jgi:hypothetical protein
MVEAIVANHRFAQLPKRRPRPNQEIRIDLTSEAMIGPIELDLDGLLSTSLADGKRVNDDMRVTITKTHGRLAKPAADQCAGEPASKLPKHFVTALMSQMRRRADGSRETQEDQQQDECQKALH